jgi:transcriptional regulator with XRE-family HTH domain
MHKYALLETMTNLSDSSLIDLLNEIRSRRECPPQAELAARFKCTQGHLSKVLAGKVRLSAKLRAQIEQVTGETNGGQLHQSRVALIESALDRGKKIMNNMHELLTEMQRLCDQMNYPSSGEKNG